MNTEQKKAVTEWLGECWHELEKHQRKCTICGEMIYKGTFEDKSRLNRTFTEWSDFGACVSRMEKTQTTDSILDLAWDCYIKECPYSRNNKPPRILYWEWLHSRTEDGTFRLPNLIAEALKEGVLK